MPTAKEMEYYGLDDDVYIFLPALDDEETEPDTMPDLVKKHVKNISVFIKSSVIG